MKLKVLKGVFTMKEPKVLVYISNNSKECENVIQFLQEWHITYQTKNVNEQRANMKELQNLGIYGTPAIFVEGEKEPILGFQKNKLKYYLGLADKSMTYYSSLFDGYEHKSDNNHRF
ncbi:Glutaredoxin [Virgibacillus pantothenticus]|nr:Glutaredoxin [Virgibacillus pantothenticus]